MKALLSKTGEQVLDVLLTPWVWCAVLWVRRRQAAILCSGTALTPQAIKLARDLGVLSPENVRVVSAVEVPLPLPRFARRVALGTGWILPHIAGMTLGYGIVLRKDCCGDANLLAHELMHVRQYERLGGVYGFLRQYLRECVWPGYPLGALEVEARAVQAWGSTLGADVIPYTTMDAVRQERRVTS